MSGMDERRASGCFILLRLVAAGPFGHVLVSSGRDFVAEMTILVAAANLILRDLDEYFLFCAYI